MRKIFALFAILVMTVSCFTACSGKTEPVPTEPTDPAETTVTEAVETQIVSELVSDDASGGQYMVISAAEPDGTVVWTYKTAVCAKEEYETVQYLGRDGDILYVNEQEQMTEEKDPLFTGCLTALDARTGAIRWQSVEFTGCGVSCVFDGKGNLYLASQKGPDCAAFNSYGLRMWILEDIPGEYEGAVSMELADDALLISFRNEDGQTAEASVGLDGTVMDAQP